mmetsp:Transcript_70809/g.124975  ORF Transcript_70809/g.124975 Transcript_70809/m.124975 type:complete len:157 (-) Transcript_70809:185-655(-)
MLPDTQEPQWRWVRVPGALQPIGAASPLNKAASTGHIQTEQSSQGTARPDLSVYTDLSKLHLVPPVVLQQTITRTPARTPGLPHSLIDQKKRMGMGSTTPKSPMTTGFEVSANFTSTWYPQKKAQGGLQSLIDNGAVAGQRDFIGTKGPSALGMGI